jgi:hypothetical protein
MRIRIVCAKLIFYVLLTAWSGRASVASDAVKVNPISSFWDCKGTCAATIFGGPLVEINFTPDWRSSWIVGGALSHELVKFQQYAAIEGEVGLAQRFGALHATEVWGAFYFRWKSFPWNNYVVTTMAFGAGLNYASRIDGYETDQSVVGHGNKLLGYLSPEITFASPARPDWELVLKVHHRSGGGLFWRDSGPFNGVWGASQFLVAGIRHRF